MKTCSKCKQYKLFSEFSIGKRYKDGYFCWCKPCVKEYANKNKAVIIKVRRKYREKKSTKEKRIAYGKEYRSRPYVKELQRKSGAEWRKNNLERHRTNAKRRYKNRAKDPIFRMTTSIRVAICTSMRKQGVSKDMLHWESMVGYKAKTLKSHLESLFDKGMTWENYGTWHIDHKIPVSFFKYKCHNDTEFKMCWMLENLQPL